MSAVDASRAALHSSPPREILTVATFPLRLHAGSCAQSPGALEDIGPGDVLVTDEH